VAVPREPLYTANVAEAISVISCFYEDKTEWGRRIGWIYGSTLVPPACSPVVAACAAVASRARPAPMSSHTAGGSLRRGCSPSPNDERGEKNRESEGAHGPPPVALARPQGRPCLPMPRPPSAQRLPRPLAWPRRWLAPARPRGRVAARLNTPGRHHRRAGRRHGPVSPQPNKKIGSRERERGRGSLDSSALFSLLQTRK
jgi:hypothetical protein